MKNFVVRFVFALTASSCAHSTVVMFQQSQLPIGQQTLVKPEDIGIYRSTRPFTNFVELGMISFRTGALGLVPMYDQLRKDAAEVGAEAVVDVKITGESHTEYVNENKCIPKTNINADGTTSTTDECHSEQVAKSVSSFLIVGSLIKEKKP